MDKKNVFHEFNKTSCLLNSAQQFVPFEINCNLVC